MNDLWIAPYHRDIIPDGIDNSAFGEIVPVVSPFDHGQKLAIKNSIYTASKLLPASNVFPNDANVRANVYAACEASVERAISEPLATTIFFPDSAALVETDDNYKLITESLWHTQLFFSKFARCDKTTDWQYRIDKNYSPVTVKGFVANAYHQYSYQYFHWFFESMPRIWALQKHLQGKEVTWFAGPLSQKFHRQSLELLDLNIDQFLRLEGSAAIKFESAYNVSFRFEESIKTLRPDFNSGLYHVGWAEDYIFEMRDRGVAKTKDLAPAISGERLYISRPDATHRNIINEKEIVKFLTEHGFEVFVPGENTLYEQIAVFRKARIIIGPHGAGLANIMWSSPGAIILEFMPEALLDVGYRFVSNLAGHNHNVLLCKELPHPLGNAYADMEVDLAALQMALREVLC